MIGLDTNILIRYIAQDDPVQSAAVVKFIERNCTSETPGYINLTVLREIIWVLKRAYGYEKKIILQILEKLIKMAELVFEYSDIVWMAIDAYKSGTADFSDYLIAFSNKLSGCKYTITFDKETRDSGLFKVLKA